MTTRPISRRTLLQCAAAGSLCIMRGQAQTPVLSGAGASFPEPIYKKWFAAFATRYPGRNVDYRAVGSGEGIELLRTGMVDFAASDHPISKDDEARMPGLIRHVPTVVGGLVPLYRLDGVVQPVRFTPEILAGIYLGKIRRWNDPALLSVNRGIPLPIADISVVHRSDRSGTTHIWTEFLSEVSAEWESKVGVGDDVRWPVEGPAAKGSAGVLEAVAAQPNSFGYVEFTYGLDRRVATGVVRNPAGKYVRADLPTLTAAAATVPANSFSDLGHIHVNITNAPGAAAYPIAAFTYLLVPQRLPEDKRDAMLELLRWVLTSGQRQSAALGYASLPTEVAAQILKTLEAA